MSDSHPMANWPPDLLHLWHTFTLSGELDAQHPPATVLDAYTQVAEIQARHMREVVQDIQQDVTALIAESEDTAGADEPAPHAGGLRQVWSR